MLRETRMRPSDDRCPGILKLAPAADGGLARIRLPGGLISARALRAVADAAAQLADPRLELTSRGNLQIRGLTDSTAADLETVLVQQGLLPSRTHERVRNIVASPLADFAALVRALDSALCANPRMAELSGRFLFGFDDGSGDIAALVPDVLATVARPGAADVAEVVAAMLTEADQFLDARAELPKSNAWRLEDLPYGLAKLAARPVHATPPAPVGVMSADGGHHLAVLVPLGRLRTKQAHALADLAQGGNLHVTPWRSVVVPFVPDPVAAVDVAESVGLGTSAGSRWYGVSSCAGRPGCAKSLADVQADAALAEHVPGVIVHWSGCARRCGRPLNTHVDFVATGSGYERLEESA